MWLKLDTGMVVMLLLFRVLVGKPESISVCPAGSSWEGEQGFSLTNRQTLTLFHSPPSSWASSGRDRGGGGEGGAMPKSTRHRAVVRERDTEPRSVRESPERRQ